jgi:hypothetical protein
MLRPAALLALQVGALTLIGEPADAPWPNQFRAMLFWLAGCVLLSLFLSRRWPADAGGAQAGFGHVVSSSSAGLSVSGWWWTLDSDGDPW